MHRQGRPGFTLIELLVVIAVIAILAALLFPVFARVRGKTLQAVCLSNLGQTSKGVRMYIDDNDEIFPFVLNGSANWTKASGPVNVDDNGKPLVPGATGQEMRYQLVTLVSPYVKNADVWYCPTVGKDWVYDYMVRQGAWTKGARMRDQGTSYDYNAYSTPWRSTTVYMFLGNMPFSILRESARWPMQFDEPHGHSADPLDPPSMAVPHFGGLNVAYGDGHVKYVRYGVGGLQWDYWWEHGGDGLFPNQ